MQYLDNVAGPGSNFDEAYFEISYLRTYTTGGSAPSSTSAPSLPTFAANPTASTKPSDSNTDTSGAASHRLAGGIVLASALVPLLILSRAW